MKTPTETPYSVKEVAIRLSSSRREGDIAFLMRQLKHWTNNNLLKTVGAKNTGTGRSREYSKQEVIAAAYLLELSRYGLTVGDLSVFRQYYDKCMKDVKTQKALLSDTGDNKSEAYLIYYTSDKHAFFQIQSYREMPLVSLWDVGADRRATSALVINCADVIERLELE